MGTILARLFGWIAPFFFDFLWGRISAMIAAYKAKKEEDKKVDGSVGKVENGDMKKGLEGTGELEDGVNKNT